MKTMLVTAAFAASFIAPAAASALTMFDSLAFWTSSALTELIVFPSFSTVVAPTPMAS